MSETGSLWASGFADRVRRRFARGDPAAVFAVVAATGLPTLVPVLAAGHAEC